MLDGWFVTSVNCHPAARASSNLELSLVVSRRSQEDLRTQCSRLRGEKAALETAVQSLEGQCDAAVARAAAAEQR